MDFVFFSCIGWQTMDGAHRPVQFARELIQRGHRVLFIEFEPSPHRPRTENVRVVYPRELGLSELEALRAWYGQDYGPLAEWRAGVARALAEFERPGTEGRVAIWNWPFAPLAELVPLVHSRGYFLVYDCLDDFEGLAASGYHHHYFPEVEDYFVSQCDLTLVLSTNLLAKFEHRAAHIALIRDGITPGAFADVPPVKRSERGLRLGFWGTVTPHMVDVALLEYIAQARPDWQIDIIGPYDEDPDAPAVAPRLRAHSNIHLLGRKPHAELPRYLADFDVCLLPAPADQFNRGRDPVKLYEYLAGGRPVVATDLPQIAWMPYVYRATSPAEFVARVKEAAATPVDPQRIQDFIAAQTWACRVDDLLQNISRITPRPAVAPFTPPAPRSSPDALRAMNAHLERLVQERTAHVHRLEALLAQTGVRPALRRWLAKLLR